MKRVTDKFALRRGRIHDRDMVFFLTHHRTAAAAGIPNAQVFFRQTGIDWAYHDMEWEGLDLALTGAPQVTCWVLGTGGRVLVGSEGGFEQERIPQAEAAALDADEVYTRIEPLGDRLAAAGAGGRVALRDAGGWEPLPPPANAGRIRALAGTGPQDLLAVGDRGAVWRRDERGWHAEQSTVEHTLYDVVKAADGQAFACGEAGVVLRREAGAWRRLDLEDIHNTFRSAAWFQDRLYLADGQGLFALGQGKLTRIPLGGDPPARIHQLDTRDQHLLAVAEDQAHYTPDGTSWTPVQFETEEP